MRKKLLPLLIVFAFMGHLLFIPTSSAFLNIFEQKPAQKTVSEFQIPRSPLSENGMRIKALWTSLQTLTSNRSEPASFEEIDEIQEKLTLAINEQLAALRNEKDSLVSKIKNPIIEERFNKFIAHYENEEDKLLNKLEQSVQNSTEESLLEAFNEAINLAFPEEKSERPLNSTPFRISENEPLKEILFNQNMLEGEKTAQNSLDLAALQKKSTKSAISIFSAPSPIAPVLSLTEVESNILEELANELHNDPVEIFNYVYNKISYTPYYGSKKGAYNTYLEKTGNDMDTALLLQTLLEASGFETRLIQAQIFLTPEQAQRLLGVNDVRTAAQHLLNTGIPVAMMIDAAGEPVYVLKEHAWLEAYLPYQDYRGLGGSTADYEWIPLDSSLKEIFTSQELNAPDAMDFDIDSFFENYLEGSMDGTPIEALQNEIASFLPSSDYSYLDYEGILTEQTRQPHIFEFLPSTLPYPLVETLASASTFDSELTHELSFSVKDSSETSLLSTTLNMEDVANKQLVLGFAPATSADQEVIDLYGSIYLTPPYLIEVKPQLRVNGEPVAEGDAISAAESIEFTLDFLAPRRELWEDIETQNIETISLNSHAGNDIAIALNTDTIISPELFPEAQESGEFWNDQKLYRTALNYLKLVEKNQKELGSVFGGTFTNEATRAFVFNGVNISTIAGVPESFDWKGLRIDSSAVINYTSYFGEIDTHKKDFTMLFGLAASLDESRIFEEDFEVEAMSTVKGITMINQGLIPGVSILKLDATNRSSIDALDLSESTKETFRSNIDDGKIIYTPTSSFTYLDWTGLVYLTLNPENGDGGYTIGEGLNGGHTVEEFENWWPHYYYDAGDNVSASILSPISGQSYEPGEQVCYEVEYSVWYLYFIPHDWTESDCIDTTNLSDGTYTIYTGYGTDESVIFYIQTDHSTFESTIDKSQLWPTCDAINYPCSSRGNAKIDKIILHHTAGGTADGAIQSFLNTMASSAHYVIDRDGTIYQLVEDKYKAWHAGVLSRPGLTTNENSIGIEIVNWGWFNKNGDDEYFFYNDPDQTKAITDTEVLNSIQNIGYEWRGYQYWQKFTDDQYTSLNGLIDTLVADHPEITSAIYEPIDTCIENDDEVNEFHGILAHFMINCGKFDPGKSFEWDRLILP